MLGNHHDAEDAVQQTIFSMWLNIKRLDRPDGFKAWMLHIARNKCLDILRAKGRRMDNETFADDEQPLEAGAEEKSDAALPEEYADNAELAEALYQMILTLPEKRRETVLLYYYEGLSTVEIAKVTGLTPGSVQGALSKARAQLLTMINEKKGFAELAGRYGAAPVGLMMANVPFDVVLKESLGKSSLVHVDAAHLEACSKSWQSAIADVKPRAGRQTAKIALPAAAICAAVLIFIGIGLGNNTKIEGASAAPPETAAPVISGILFEGDCSCGHINPHKAQLSGQGLTDGDTSWEIFAGAIGTSGAAEPPIYSGTEPDATGRISEMKASGQTGDFTLRFRAPDPEGAAYYSRVFTIE